MNDGGPAFPLAISDENNGTIEYVSGASLWDYYAAKALEGLLASPDFMIRIIDGHSADYAHDCAVSAACKIATAMLQAKKIHFKEKP